MPAEINNAVRGMRGELTKFMSHGRPARKTNARSQFAWNDMDHARRTGNKIDYVFSVAGEKISKFFGKASHE